LESFLPRSAVNLISVEEKENMSWDREFFIPKNEILVDEKEADEKTDKEKMFARCAGCNELIGIVSVTLYEIEKKHYCSGCYSREITALAVERDHFDIDQEKKRCRSKK
jgi:hypothetical protein